MANNMTKYFKIVGELHSQINKSETLDEALQESLRIITSRCDTEYAVIWYYNEKDDLLHPYYWIGARDFTSISRPVNEGDVGKCFSEQTPVNRIDYKADPDPVTDNSFAGIDIVSSICVPLSNKYDKLGTIQFVNTSEKGMFNEELADVFDMLSMMIAIDIDDNPSLQEPWTPGKTLIKVRGVKKSFLNGSVTTQVLKGVNLDVYEGEFLVLLGESGCGKSTLLNIIGGMESADEGRVIFGDQNITQANEEELTKFRRDNLGFIFQSYNLMSNLNARQNLNLIGELVKDPMDTDKALELVGLLDRAENYPSQLSGGQQQRISIARALIKNPALIFADEPTAALDYTTSIEVLEVLEKVVKSGTTMVMVTHNEEITRMADRVIRMRNGQVYEVVINRHPVHANELVW